MGRWGNGIYESDHAHQFVDKLYRQAMREAHYHAAPEHIYQTTIWLQEMITVVEIALILDTIPTKRKINLLHYDEAARRWKKTFLDVWDAEWNEKKSWISYCTYAYRVTHRQIIHDLFNRLIALCDSDDDLPPFVLNDQLPYFSAIYVSREHGGEWTSFGSFLSTLIDNLKRSIIYFLSEETTAEGVLFDEVAVAVDLLGLLCEKYRLSPRLQIRTIERWLNKTTTICFEWFSPGIEARDAQSLMAHNEYYRNVVTAFVRLMNVARQYPSGNPL